MCVYVEVLQFFVFDAKLFLYPLLNNDLHNLLNIFKKLFFFNPKSYFTFTNILFYTRENPKIENLSVCQEKTQKSKGTLPIISLNLRWQFKQRQRWKGSSKDE